MRFCSFRCKYSESNEAQHAACMAVNGVYCTILEEVIEKGSPCPVKPEHFPGDRDKNEDAPDE
jgi:hypothetical protein